jgi:hypothetical protein
MLVAAAMRVMADDMHVPQLTRELLIRRALVGFEDTAAYLAAFLGHSRQLRSGSIIHMPRHMQSSPKCFVQGAMRSAIRT